jgi:hypothetical protein
MIATVTNKLASLFIEENLKLREQQAQGTSEFLSSELNAMKKKLEGQERLITNFKRQFMGELPEQRDANLRILEQLQLQYQRISDNLRAAQDRRLFIQKQLSDFELIMASEAAAKGSPVLSLPVKAKSPREIELEQLKAHLSDLQIKYTEKHPDILTVKKKIAEREAVREKPGLEEERGLKIEEKNLAHGIDPRLNEIKDRLMVTEKEIERLKEEDVKLRAQMAKYSERVEKTFAREQE